MPNASPQTAARRPSHLHRALWFTTGADIRILTDAACSEADRKRFTSIGLAMCITMMAAFVSGVSLCHQIFFPSGDEVGQIETILDLTASIAFGAIWALIIFNMQRFLMFGSRRDSSRARVTARDLVHALPGLVLSFFIALTVATPLQALVFRPEIEIHLTKERQAAKTTAFTRIRNDYREEARALASKQLEQQKRATGTSTMPPHQIDVADWPDVCRDLQIGSDVDDTRRAKNARAQCLERLDKEINLLRQGMANRELNRIRTDADDQRGFNDEERFLSLRMQRERVFAELTVDQSPGLLKEVATAYEVDPLFSWLLLLVIFLIQAVPVLVRTMSPKGPYDDLLDIENRKRLAAAGIEPDIVHIRSKTGSAVPVDYYLMQRAVVRQLLTDHRILREHNRNERTQDAKRRYVELKQRIEGRNAAE